MHVVGDENARFVSESACDALREDVLAHVCILEWRRMHGIIGSKIFVEERGEIKGGDERGRRRGE